MDAEHHERKTANIAWMRAGFAKAKADGSHGLVLMSQANPGFENYWPSDAPRPLRRPFVGRGAAPPRRRRPLMTMSVALTEELEGYDKPVAYLHGDTHLFRIDKPLYSKKTKRLFENFTRMGDVRLA